ncbi:ROK family protein [Cohnella nanjingensis]|uniref:ROK family protein n=1 Tax=Cohnella nanjingensis TaxID=1387779 RepID=A0A7X0RPA6_9BACL|nr:ROK family protein [Cohnella nanjingensis]MBB6671202.1 ROK family protein [Cohnella nanjingensis]
MNVTIDFGGTNIKIGLVREGSVLVKTSIPALSDNGLLTRLPDVEQGIRRLLSGAGVSLADCRGIGIALPGIIDGEGKTLLSIKDKYTDALGFDFAGWSASQLGLPLVVENDARAALLGEIAYGNARGEKDAVLVIFGTGIGTAAMIGGEVVRGRHGQAGILGGHLATDIYGERCNCGNPGCLEAQASHWAIPLRAAKLPGFADSMLAGEKDWGYETILRASEEGDAFAARLEADLLLHWGAGIVNLIHAYDPEVVILSGGLMKSADRLLPRLAERVRETAWTPWGTPRFTVAEDPETSVLLGMSYLASRQQHASKGE